jgi:UDP-glucose 4-epimerase
VEDLCQAHLLAAQRLLQEGSTSEAEFFNLANGNGYSVLEVIETCRRITGQPIEAKHSPRRAGDPACLIGQATLAHQVLGWSPKHSLEKIIEDAWRVQPVYVAANPSSS